MRERNSAKRPWRDYRTPSGNRPVKEFIEGLSDADAAEVVAAMKDVEFHGLRVAKHLRGDLWQLTADGARESFRILFAPEGERGQVLLALHGFSKKTQRTPHAALRVAESRLRSWRERGRV